MKKIAFILWICAALTACGEEQVSSECPKVLKGWTTPKDGLDPHGIHVTVSLSGGSRLRLAPTLAPVAHVLFDPRAADTCRRAEQVRNEIDQLADCRGKGLCGQGELGEFNRLRDTGAVWHVKRPADAGGAAVP